MFSRFVLVVGGLIAAIAALAAADAHVVRSDIVTADFGRQVVADILDDPVTRAPLVDDVTEQWIADHPDRFRLLAATSTAPRETLRAAIDDVMASDAFEAELDVVFADLGERQDALGQEEFTLDLGPAVQSVAADVSAPIRAALDGESDVTLSRDLSLVSSTRSLLDNVRWLGTGATLAALVMMGAATRSFRRPFRTFGLFGVPLAFVQPWLLEVVLDSTPSDLVDVYTPVVTSSITEAMSMPFTAMLVAFAAMLAVEVLMLLSTAFNRAQRSAAFSHEGNVIAMAPSIESAPPIIDATHRPAGTAPTGPTWIDPGEEEQRVAS